MPAPRRTGSESSKTRAHLLDVTERLMLDEGYAAVSSRRVAKEADVTPPLVHYYFPTLDDLFIAVFRRRAEEQLARHARLLAADRPLRAMWAFNAEPAAVAFINEFMALANHRKSIGTEIATAVDRFRQAQIDAVTTAVRDGQLDIGDASVPALVFFLTSAAHTIGTESVFGVASGHQEAIAFVEDLLRRTEPAATDGPLVRAPARARSRRTPRPSRGSSAGGTR